jgi:hypothetical protein
VLKSASEKIATFIKIYGFFSLNVTHQYGDGIVFPEVLKLSRLSILRCWVDNIKMDLREIDGMVWTGSNWLRIWTSGGLL